MGAGKIEVIVDLMLIAPGGHQGVRSHPSLYQPLSMGTMWMQVQAIEKRSPVPDHPRFCKPPSAGLTSPPQSLAKRRGPGLHL